jgi:4-amino-4-deoxy-L-arabinose transferase-like glycosyltransferase
MLVDYLQANKGDAEYLVATPNAMSASPIILNTDEPVITLGGFMGRDPAVTSDELARLVDRGSVRFALLPDRERMEEMRAEREAEYGPSPYGPPPGGPPSMDNAAVTWVQDNCEKVPQEQWQSPDSDEQGGGGPPGPPGRFQVLYDCSTGGS